MSLNEINILMKIKTFPVVNSFLKVAENRFFLSPKQHLKHNQLKICDLEKAILKFVWEGKI